MDTVRLVKYKCGKIKMDKTPPIFNEISLSTRLSPCIEFPNSRINHLVLRRIHNPRVHLLLVLIPKLTP